MDNVHIERDKESHRIRFIEHFQQPYSKFQGFLGDVTPKVLALEYLNEVSSLLEINTEMLEGAEKQLAPNKITFDQTAINRLEYESERPAMGTTVVTFAQTYMGIPVVGGGISIYVNNSPLQITRSHNSIHYDIEVKKPSPDARFMPTSINEFVLSRILGSKFSENLENVISIFHARILIYQYNPDLRIDPKLKENKDFQNLVQSLLTLPDVSPSIHPNGHYCVTEVVFSITVSNYSRLLKWRIYIEVETGSVLYLFALFDFADGFIYLMDPLRTTGIETIRPSSLNSVLDPLRTLIALEGLSVPSNQQGNQDLKGDLVEVVNASDPPIEPPIESYPYSFQYSVLTDNFAAVNAYYHSYLVFKMAIDMGFPFRKTKFPVKVDHRATPFGCQNGNCLNASAEGSVNGGSEGFLFALAESNTSFGIANCFDIVLHEFCHALLWESISHPNLGFAHNSGDALAAIICDVDSKSPDKGRTFYCELSSPRRHDRKVVEGWAWGGTYDTGYPRNGGYLSEQILSTTMFRIYKAIGGGSASEDTRRKASKYMSYLILKTISSLDTHTRAGNVREYVSILMNADLTTDQYEGFFGGYLNKVIRWAFEKQGLFQKSEVTSPVSSEGDPPEVDVYIDEERMGEYIYLTQQTQAKDICNRYAPDTVFEHQNPILGEKNFVYVKIRNRGISNAKNITVKVYQLTKLANPIFPTDCIPLDNPIIINGYLRSNGEMVVGPFRWIPTNDSKSIFVVVSATGDMSNAEASHRTVPIDYLVRFDNNNGLKPVQIVRNDP